MSRARRHGLVTCSCAFVVISLAASCSTKRKETEGSPGERRVTTPRAEVDADEEEIELDQGGKAMLGLGNMGTGPALLPKPGEFAIVAGNGLLYAAAEDKLEPFHRGRLHLPHAFPARVINADATWTELELVAGPGPARDAARRCFEMPDALSALRLRVFAKTAGLLYTPAKRLTRSFDDHTRMELLPGVPMFAVRGTPTTYVAGNASAVFTVTLAAGDLARSFVPAAGEPAWRELAAPPPLKPLRHKSVGRGTRGVTNTKMRMVFRVDEHPGPPLFRAGWTHPKGALLEWRAPCFAVRAIVPADKVVADAYRFGGGGMAPPRGRMLLEGTELFWPDGRRAGVTVGRTPIGPTKPAGRGLACAALHFDWMPHVGLVKQPRLGAPLRLCVKTAPAIKP